jgi:glycosyltransferase involved in cell wall biosynthesis
VGKPAAPSGASATDRFRDFGVVNIEGRLYGVPPRIVHVNPGDHAELRRHPAVVSAPTEDLLQERIAAYDPRPHLGEEIGEFEEYRLIRHEGWVYAVRRDLGFVDLNWDEDRLRDGVVRGKTREEVEARIREARGAAPVEYLGWLPVFKFFGNCGAHPQFGHTDHPPPGYRFVRSQPPYTAGACPEYQKRAGLTRRLWAKVTAPYRAAQAFVRNVREFGAVQCFATLMACLRLVWLLLRKTGRLKYTLQFVRSRHFRSQVMAPRRADLTFLTSIPQTYGQNPWVIEIEDSTTLLYPFLPNGQTADIDHSESPFTPMVKALLEHDNCRGILTHMRSTAESLPTLFGSDIIARKVSYAPLGVRLPERWQTHDTADGTINLLFTSSWHQQGVGFYLRGGLDVLEAFEILQARYPQLRLTLRCPLPRLDERYQRIVEKCWVRVIERFLPAGELDELQRGSHVCLLPSARVHIVSVLQAMSYGQAVVVSDGWGMDEYVDHDRTGLIVGGRAGKTSWMDRKTGLLRENYAPMYVADPVVVDGIVNAVSRLVEGHAYRQRIGRAARREVEEKYNLRNWNAALKAVFDKARAAG